MDIGTIIKNYRKEHKLTLREFASRCGTSHSYIAMLEKGENSKTGEPMVPTLDTYKKIARGLNMSLNDLIAMCDDMPVSMVALQGTVRPAVRRRIPLLGNVACGEPIFAAESHETYVDADADINADFCLTAKGDSMINARIFDGDILFVKQQDMVNDGEIAVVLIEDEATVKRVYYDRENSVLTLMPENPTYKPMRYTGDALSQIRILGRVIAGQYKV